MKPPSPPIRRSGAVRADRAIRKLIARQAETPADRARSGTDETRSVSVGAVDGSGDFQKAGLWSLSNWGEGTWG